MPKRVAKTLTDLSIAKLTPPKSGRKEVFDAGQDGLAVRVSSAGSKSFIVYYTKDGRRHKHTLGKWQNPSDFPKAAQDSVLGIRRARLLASEKRADPDAAERRQNEEAEAARISAREQRTFGDVAENYIALQCRPRRNAAGDVVAPAPLKRGWEIERIIYMHLMPHWRDRPFANLTRADANALIDRLLQEGKEAAAHRLFEIVKRIARWTVLDRGDFEDHPHMNLRPPVKKVSRDRWLREDEIKRLWTAWADTEVGAPFGHLFRFMLATGQRRGECAEARWSEIDLDRAVWTVPAQRTKSAREHLVPLSRLALEILADVPRAAHSAGDFIFSTTDGERPVSGLSKAKARADRLSSVTDWRTHDLRRTAATYMAQEWHKSDQDIEPAVPPLVVARILNHAPKSLIGVTAVYVRSDLMKERRAALDRWARQLLWIVAPDRPGRPDNVIDLPQRRSG